MSPPIPRTPFPRALTLALPILLAASVPALGAGGDPVWVFPGIEDVNCADEIEDQDADGVPDLIVETYDAGAVGDHLYCLSGGAPGPGSVTIWSVKPPGGVSSGGGYGDECVRTAPDLTGDGIEDVLLGTAWGGRTAYGIDGTDGSVVWDFDTYVDSPPTPPLSGWVYTVCPVPDVDGDMFPDAFFGCGSDNDRAYHVSGLSGVVLWSLDLGDAVFASAALEDVSGDSRADVVVGVGDFADAVWCLRGGPAALPTIWTHPMPGSVLAVARIADLTGDGVNDVLAGTWDSSVHAYDGATGTPIWLASLPGFAYVMRIAVLDDVNGDGFEDAAIGTWDDRVFVLSGIDGIQVWSTPTGGDVWAVGRVADATGDGINDVVAGSFDHLVYLLDGASGTIAWSHDTGNRLYFVTGTSDLTGNGVPDVFAGTQKLTGSPGGRGFLLEGGDGPPTSADLPVRLEGEEVAGGIALRLSNAFHRSGCIVERSEGVPNGPEAARRFRREIAGAYREGLLTTTEAMQARFHDPRIRWSRLTPRALPVVGGSATFLDRTAQTGRTYTYRFALLRESTVVGYSPAITIPRIGDGATVAVPEILAHPNPFAASGLAIEFRLDEAQPVRLVAFDPAGRRVATIHEGTMEAGRVRLEWDGRQDDGAPLPNGVYFLRLEGRDFVSSRKVTVLR